MDVFAIADEFDDFTDCRFHRSRRCVYSNEYYFRSCPLVRRIIVVDSLAFFIRHEERSDWWRVSILRYCCILFRLDLYTSKYKSFCEIEKDVTRSLPSFSRCFHIVDYQSKYICWSFILLLLEKFFFFLVDLIFWSRKLILSYCVYSVIV